MIKRIRHFNKEMIAKGKKGNPIGNLFSLLYLLFDIVKLEGRKSLNYLTVLMLGLP